MSTPDEGGWGGRRGRGGETDGCPREVAAGGGYWQDAELEKLTFGGSLHCGNCWLILSLSLSLSLS